MTDAEISFMRSLEKRSAGPDTDNDAAGTDSPPQMGAATLFIPAPPGSASFHGLGFLHLFALFTFVSVPRAVLAARAHDVNRHARIVSGFLVGGLGLAGLLAFLPGRLMWQVVFG